MHIGKQLLSGEQLRPRFAFPANKKLHKQRMSYSTQPPVTAREICKLKCKAGLSTTLVKSHIKSNRESVCAGGNESEAKPRGSSASYLVSPLFFTALSLPRLSLPTQFPPISIPVLYISPLLLTIFITFSFPTPASLVVSPPAFLSPPPPLRLCLYL